MNVVDFRAFYLSPLGEAVRHLLGRKLAARLKPKAGDRVMGLGYALPYLDDHVPDAATSLALMLARQGVIHWPASHNARSCLVDEFDLPFLESVADWVVVTHGLELCDAPLEMLQEIWRILAPQGRLLLVVPNRRGLWSASETSPFGYGQPFSKSQLTALLKEARFSVTHWDNALYLPPSNRPALIKGFTPLESTLNQALSRFSGVIVVEAMKEVYAFSSGKRARRFVPRFRPALLPAPRPANKAVPQSGESGL